MLDDEGRPWRGSARWVYSLRVQTSKTVNTEQRVETLAVRRPAGDTAVDDV